MGDSSADHDVDARAGARNGDHRAGGAAEDLTDSALLATVRSEDLAAFADPADVELHSHRAVVGRVIVGAKRLLQKLLTPVLERQGAFNRAAADSLAGLSGVAGARFASLARRVLELESRLDAIAVPDRPADDGLDRRAFEEAFRGSREHVGRMQSRYLEHFRSPEAGPVLDLGCGRGEFLRLLRDAGVAGYGVERDPDLVEEARRDGLDVRLGDALWALECAVDGSLGGVVSFQVIEHLPFPSTVRLVHLARTKLRPGGRLILETVNVQSLITWTRGWSVDPTHRQPVHPLTLRFLVERAGFSDVELVYSGEVQTELRLEEGEAREEREARNARRLNDLLFAPQDFAVVARA